MGDVENAIAELNGARILATKGEYKKALDRIQRAQDSLPSIIEHVNSINKHFADLKRTCEDGLAKAVFFTVAQTLAIMLHKFQCHLYHGHAYTMNECAWEYEQMEHGIHEWHKPVHNGYLDRAEKVIATIGEDSALQMIEGLKALPGGYK